MQFERRESGTVRLVELCYDKSIVTTHHQTGRMGAVEKTERDASRDVYDKDSTRKLEEAV